MPQPYRMTSELLFHNTVRETPTVFAMFYQRGEATTRAFRPIWELLCSKHSSSSTTFIEIEKDDFPDLNKELGVPNHTILTFLAFRNKHLKDVIEGVNSRELERFVDRNEQSTTRRPATAPRTHREVDLKKSRPRRDRARSPARVVVDSPRRHHSPAPRRVPVYHAQAEASRRRRRSSPDLVPVNYGSPDFEGSNANRSYPVGIRYTEDHGSHRISQPAHLEYTGQDGRRRRAHDVRLQKGPDGRPEATFLGWSGSLAVERTVGR